MSPTMAGGMLEPPHHSDSRADVLVPTAPNILHQCRRRAIPSACVLGVGGAALQPPCEIKHLQIFPFPHGRKEGVVGGRARKWSKQKGLGCGKSFFTLFL